MPGKKIMELLQFQMKFETVFSGDHFCAEYLTLYASGSDDVLNRVDVTTAHTLLR